MNAHSATRVTLLVATLLSASPAAAWRPIASSRPVWNDTVRFALNESGSDDLDFATVEADVRRGMEDWARLSCTDLLTHYEGVTSLEPRGGDEEFVIGWVESGWAHGSSAIGVTGVSFSSGRIHESDMEMNGVHFEWTTDPGSGDRVNLYSIALHESGHWLGLGHSSDHDAIMYASYSGGVGTIGSDDQTGICALYPGSGGGTSDCAVTGCPAGAECVDGTCRTAPLPDAGGDLCTPCESSSECGGSADRCLGYAEGGRCGRACVSDDDCEGSAQCSEVSSNLRQCVRYVDGTPSCEASVPPAPPSSTCSNDADCASNERCGPDGRCTTAPTGELGVGDACDTNEACATGVCHAGVCAQTCAWPHGACPEGTYCEGEATRTCGPGICLPGSAGAGEEGDRCNGPTQCRSLACSAGRCVEPCQPGDTGTCGAARVCLVGALPCRGVCGERGELGDPCLDNGECVSGLCASRSGRGFCSRTCDEVAGCGEGFTCYPTSAASVCVPDGGVLGDECSDHLDCVSGLCAREGDRAFCTRMCDDATPCPGRMSCVGTSTPDVQVCRSPASERPEASPNQLLGTCTISRRGSRSGTLIPLLLPFALIIRRRR